MRYAVISDVHSNLEALEAVLEALSREGVNRLLCAGDMVGYGADPAACLGLVRREIHQAVLGNHDDAAIGQMDLNWFNQPAASAVRWTREHLGEPDREYLKGLPLVWKNEEVMMAHGSLYEPEEFHYLFDPTEAKASFSLQETPVAFIGHTHVPGLFVQEGSRVSFLRPVQIQLGPSLKYLVNVGSVGQPRDGDPRACFALYDTDSRTVEFRRVSYPIEKTQAKIRAAGLPQLLAERLACGY